MLALGYSGDLPCSTTSSLEGDGIIVTGNHGRFRLKRCAQEQRLLFQQEENPVHGDSFAETPKQRKLAKLQVEPWIAQESVTGYVNVPTDSEQKFNVESGTVRPVLI